HGEEAMKVQLKVGDEVTIAWGLDEIRGRITEIYGTAPRLQVVVELTPELSGYVVDRPTTVSLPADDVHAVAA
ncbi:MAG TPA: hypothetical protein VGS21_10970, partial [Acidimicrobiales bacterium]|nr:hypothetical protein [Acidimicrobiales bacterium]